MPLLNDRLRLELVPMSQMVHFVAASFEESVYGEISPYAPMNLEDIESQLSTFREGKLPGNQLHWAIRDHTDNECLGSIQSNLRTHRTVEIGYRVRSAHQNQGIGTAALALLVGELLHCMPDHVLIASVHPGNLASVRVLLKANFTLVKANTDEALHTSNSQCLFQYSQLENSAA